MIPATQPFQATWTGVASCLKPPTPTTLDKVKEVAYLIFSVVIFPVGIARLIGFGLGKLIGLILLPAALYSKETVKAANEDFSWFWKTDKDLPKAFIPSSHKVITPDKATLDVTFLKHKDATAKTPTLIYYGGNGELSKNSIRNASICMQNLKANTPCNFVFFDYRGVGNSTGKMKQSKDLVVDSASILQWTQKVAGTPDDQIMFYGRSLGATTATQTQALSPKTLTGKHVNERSFSTLEKIIESIVGKGIFSRFIHWIAKTQGYAIDSATAFQKIKGEKLVIYHPEDEVIPESASLQKEVKHPNQLILSDYPSSNHHNNPLWCYADQNGKSAFEKVGSFLFGASENKESLAG